MIQVSYVRNGEFRKLTSKEDFRKLWRDLDFIWVNIAQPNKEEQELLELYLSVDAKSLVRVVEESSLGRYHRFFEYSAFHVPTMKAEPLLHVEPAVILLGEKIVATISSNIPVDAIAEVEETIRNLIATDQDVTPSIVVVRIIQEIIERNVVIINRIAMSTIQLEEQFTDISVKDLLSNIQRIRHYQNEFYQHLTIQRHIVDLMLQHVPRYLHLTEELRTLLGTTTSEIERQQQTLEINARSLTDLVSLNSIFLANRLNRIIVILTAITVTVAVPSLVANMLGMYNIFNPNPLFYLGGGIPIFTWQLQLLIMIPAIIIPLIWVIRKGWARPFPTEGKQ
ncbi:MAG: CorA family divalent cation transporter [Candidatus Hodarchaeota archaeon]